MGRDVQQENVLPREQGLCYFVSSFFFLFFYQTPVGHVLGLRTMLCCCCGSVLLLLEYLFFSGAILFSGGKEGSIHAVSLENASLPFCGLENTRNDPRLFGTR